MTTETRECVHESEFNGVPVRVFTIQGSGVYQPEWLLRGHWYRGYGSDSVKTTLAEAHDRLRWERVASNPNA
jgi:asparagine N-glycosylation enzyme membrane subunit Stt3